jgi:hypothetical protein
MKTFAAIIFFSILSGFVPGVGKIIATTSIIILFASLIFGIFSILFARSQCPHWECFKS